MPYSKPAAGELGFRQPIVWASVAVKEGCKQRTAVEMRRFVLPGLLLCSVLVADAASAQTGTQSGVTGNPDCPQPVLPGGIRPKNWSCPTGSQSPFSQESGQNQGNEQPQDGQYDGSRGLQRDSGRTALRCEGGEAMVGARIRRGDVLDHIQIACARVGCVGQSCQWETARWGMAAGNPNGGQAQRPLLCNRNEVVTGLRARQVTFTESPYVADIEVECAQFALPDEGTSSGARGLNRTPSSPPNWRHGSGGLRSVAPPPNAIRNVIGPPLSCRPNGNAQAFSVAESDFVNPGQRVIQDISLQCPDGQRSDDEEAASTEDMMAGIDRCLYQHSSLSYYRTPDLRTYGGRATYQRSSSTVFFNPDFLDQQRPYPKAFWLAAVYGAHVANLEQTRFGVTRPERQRLGIGDYVAGFIAKCLARNGFLPIMTNNSPDDPRLQYGDFLRYSGFALPEDPPGVQRTLVDWENGWFAYGMGLHPSLRHE